MSCRGSAQQWPWRDISCCPVTCPEGRRKITLHLTQNKRCCGRYSKPGTSRNRSGTLLLESAGSARQNRAKMRKFYKNGSLLKSYEILTASYAFHLQETVVIYLAIQSWGRNVLGKERIPSLLNSSHFVLRIRTTS